MKLNLACGDNVIKGFVNVDMIQRDGVDLVHDIRKPLPFADQSVEQVVLYHAIEHIERRNHEFLLRDIHRVLVPAGKLSISYPEFSVCYQNWLSNYKGMRDFWEATMFGRQLGPGDYHVVPMCSGDFKLTLIHCGFAVGPMRPEPEEPHNTIVHCVKDMLVTYPDALTHNVEAEFQTL